MIQATIAPEFFDAIKEAVRTVIKEELKQQAEKASSETYLTPKETAKALRISRGTLFNWTQSGKIPSHRAGGKVLYRKSEIAEAVQSVKKYVPMKAA